MWFDNEIIRADLEYITTVSFIDWEKFRNSSFFITGGTGLIGTWIVNSLVYANMKFDLNMELTLLVRNKIKAQEIFNTTQKYSGCVFNFIESDIENFSQNIKCDYVIHAANPTASNFFTMQPVETIKATVFGSMNVLEAVKDSAIKGFIYLSSMEIYGNPTSDEEIKEDHYCNLDLSSARSSYPESKRLCEALCISYWKEFNVPTRIVRLTQTFGPGVRYDDQRVFAQFARSVIEKKDIVLVTKGQTKRSYLYIADAVTAIFLLLQRGKDGEAYNVANEETYCSILEMANLNARKMANNEISVRIQEDINKKMIYAPTLCMNLNVMKIRRLGWHPEKDLYDMFSNMIRFWKGDISELPHGANIGDLKE